jgi:hypothetical protein
MGVAAPVLDTYARGGADALEREGLTSGTEFE